MRLVASKPLASGVTLPQLEQPLPQPLPEQPAAITKITAAMRCLSREAAGAGLFFAFRGMTKNLQGRALPDDATIPRC
jgi:hypothetical protein